MAYLSSAWDTVKSSLVGLVLRTYICGSLEGVPGEQQSAATDGEHTPTDLVKSPGTYFTLQIHVCSCRAVGPVAASCAPAPTLNFRANYSHASPYTILTLISHLFLHHKHGPLFIWL